jgi:hypothetical protein
MKDLNFYLRLARKHLPTAISLIKIAYKVYMVFTGEAANYYVKYILCKILIAKRQHGIPSY